MTRKNYRPVSPTGTQAKLLQQAAAHLIGQTEKGHSITTQGVDAGLPGYFML